MLKALKGHFEYPVKLHGIAIQAKFATHVRWSVLPSPGFSPAIVPFSAKPGLDQITNRTNGTVEDPNDGNTTEHAYPGVSLVFSYLQVCKASIIPPLFARSVMLQS